MVAARLCRAARQEASRQRSDNHVITVSEDEVRRAFKRVNVRKAAGPDGITGRVLRSCADQLVGLFTSIFNESLATSVVPTSFKKSIIIPVPKNNKPSCLNDYRPVALTSIVMKVFERLVKSHISSSIPVTLDPLRPNRSTDDAITYILHSSLTHIDSSNGNFARLLFIDYSSAFNTIVPIKLSSKLTERDLHHGARTTVSLWMRAKLKSWLWTSERVSSSLALLLWQWDSCGEGKQLQIPRCKHLRGPDLDYTHSNTG